jgi:isoleucyl-tRNA synthetase
MEGLIARHPLVDRASPVVLASYVTTEAGTGVVHTAPGHGADDFETGRRYGLPTLVPVDKAGRFTAEAIRHVGRPVLEANADIVADLRAAGALVRDAVIVHSYPTCWRCRGAVIFLATDQWFWRVDHLELRARTLEHVDAATWIPAWGHDRMHDSVASRPDWCLSRQRSWGVPIPAFECRACGTPVVSAESLARAEQVVREGGSEAWIATPAAELAPAGLSCPSCGGTDLLKDPNILDVWFDSACTHLAVLASGRWPEVQWPADLYLEGSDQHRGWFQVSLLSGVALEGAPPFKAVYTHGLILDEQGRKMSKSLGNVVAPEEILKTHGADVLRLLFASLDCTADIRFSKALLDPAAESYRKIRNTLRFLMGNLASFDPDRHAVDDESLAPTDRFAMERLREVSRDVRAAYDELLFNKALRLLHVYLATDVSAFSAHVTKDRLYCDAPDAPSRRSAQTLLFEIARECCSLLAPILCFTAEEAWEQLPSWSGKASSVHVGSWRALPAPSPAILAEWAETMAARGEILKALERARAAGLIGDPLEAAITVGASGSLGEILRRREEVLAEILVVSTVSLAPAGALAPAHALTAESVEGLWVSVERARGIKCPRCWQYREDSGDFAAEPSACGRCARVLEGLGVELDPS